MVAEDKSKLDTSDTVITYSQTKAELRLGLARLYLEYSRTAQRDLTVLITQAYTTGQFAIQSALMQSAYWDKLAQATGDGSGDDSE